MDRFKIAIVIPAYNEEKTIEQVVKKTLLYGLPIVVNDGSKDNTSTLAKSAGAIVINHLSNKGYDEALNSGFKEAYGRKFEVIITLDADGQHNPLLLASFIEEIDKGYSLVLGVRNKYARISEHLFSIYARMKYGIKDPMCGMKAYSMKAYENLGYFDSYNSIGTELVFNSIKNNFNFKEVNITTKNRLDKPRFGRVISANLKIVRSIFLDLTTGNKK